MILRFAEGGGSKGGNYPRLAFSQPGKYNVAAALRQGAAPGARRYIIYMMLYIEDTGFL